MLVIVCLPAGVCNNDIAIAETVCQQLILANMATLCLYSIMKNASEAIKRSGLTDRQLSEKIGVGIPAINRYRSGQRLPDLDVVPKLAAALGVPRAVLRPDWAAALSDDAP